MFFELLMSLEYFVNRLFPPPPEKLPPTPSQPNLKVSIRWLIRRDMPEILDIERQSFEFPWSEEDFLCCLRKRDCIGMVAEYNHRIAGFMIYKLYIEKIHILNFAVDPEFRRQKVGTEMAKTLIEKLSQQRRQQIAVQLRESNLNAQIFFKKMGFYATLVLHNYYDDVKEDSYLMQYHKERTDIPFMRSQSMGTNRIAAYYDAP